MIENKSCYGLKVITLRGAVLTLHQLASYRS